MQRYTVYFIFKLLYMFRVVPPPIIRSANNCIYSIWYCHTVTAICRYRGRVGTGLSVLWVAYVTQHTQTRIVNGLVRHPVGRRNWNSKGPATRSRWQFFFDSQGVVHKEFVPKGKTVFFINPLFVTICPETFSNLCVDIVRDM